MANQVEIVGSDASIIYAALCMHDGNSLAPEWPVDKRKELTAALDRFRLRLQMDVLEGIGFVPLGGGND